MPDLSNVTLGVDAQLRTIMLNPLFANLPKLLGNFTNLSHTQIFIHMYTIKTRYTDIK